MIDRRAFLTTTALVAASLVVGRASAQRRRKPNFIVIQCDDLGYGDIGARAAGMIATPNLDRMAREGTRFTDFYAGANICTPSRAAMLTGRYAVRTGLGVGVIMQGDKRGLPLTEVTIAQALKPDYASALIGKWHLGHVAPYWPPTVHGFDYYFGIPYSHDMMPLSLFESRGSNAPLTEEKVVYPRLQQRFCEKAEQFITANKDRPFFLDLALSGPHLANYPDAAFKGKSAAGGYGDVVEELDDIVGRVLTLLRRLGIARDTLVLFTSDNGPWYEGSAGGLRQRKGGAGYDGGYRVPMIAWQPGTVPAGRSSAAIGMSIDFLPTFCAMAGIGAPPGVKLDGKDITAMLTRGAPSPHDELVLFDNEDVVAIRTQHWKYVATDYYRGNEFNIEHSGYPQLYDMTAPTAENYSVAARHPDILSDMKRRLAAAQAEFAPFRTVKSTIFDKSSMVPRPPAPDQD